MVLIDVTGLAGVWLELLSAVSHDVRHTRDRTEELVDSLTLNAQSTAVIPGETWVIQPQVTCYQPRSPCQDPAGNWTTQRPPDHRKETHTVSRSSGLAKTILQGTVTGGRRQGRQRKRWEDNIREWTGLEFAKSQRAVENREKWRKLGAKSSVVPQQPSWLQERWWWWWWWWNGLSQKHPLPLPAAPEKVPLGQKSHTKITIESCAMAETKQNQRESFYSQWTEKNAHFTFMHQVENTGTHIACSLKQNPKTAHL